MALVQHSLRIAANVVELKFGTTAAHIGWFLGQLGARVTLVDDGIEARLNHLRSIVDEAPLEPDRLIELGTLSLISGKELLDGDGTTGVASERLADADIILVTAESGGPEEAERCAQLRGRYPKALIASITPFGLSGERSGWAANDFLTYHAGGDAYFLPPGAGSASRAPVVAGDYAPGRMAGWTVLAALLAHARHVKSTGQGALFEVSCQEALLDLSRVEFSRAANNGAIESRLTKAYETGGIMFASDRPVVVMPLEDHQWAKLFSLFGDPDWSQSEGFTTRDGRRQHAGEVQARLQAWVAEHTSEEVYELGQAAGVPIGVVRTASDILTTRQAAARASNSHELTPIGIEVATPSLPFLFSSNTEGAL